MRLAILVLALWPAFLAAETPQIRCVDGMCLVPLSVLESLVKSADSAQHYAQLCAWSGFK